MMKSYLIYALLFILCFVPGCSNFDSGDTVILDEIGFTMKLPPGWTVDPYDPGIYYGPGDKEDNWGMAQYFTLKDESWTEYVNQMNSPGATILSKKRIDIDKQEAVEFISEANYTLIEVNIRKGNQVIRASFRMLKDDYPDHEEEFKQAFKTINLD